MVWEGLKRFTENLFTKHPEQWDYEGMKQGFAGTCDVIQSALTAQRNNTPGCPGNDSSAAVSSRCLQESSNNDTETYVDLLNSHHQSDAPDMPVDPAEKSALVFFSESRVEILQRYLNAEEVLIGWEGRGIEVYFSIHPYMLRIGDGPLGEEVSRRFDCIVSYLPYTYCPGGDIGKVVESSLRLLNTSGEIHLVLTIGTNAETVQFPGYNHRLMDSVGSLDETDAGIMTYLLEPITASISDSGSGSGSGSSISSITPTVSVIEAADRNRLNCDEQKRLNASILVTTENVDEGPPNRVFV